MTVSATTTARGLAVWTTATAVALAVIAAAAAGAPDPAEAASSFPDLLALAAAAALAVCALWGWLSVTVVLAEAATGRVGRTRGVPGALRRAVLVLCGVTALAALAAPATAADPRPDDGGTIAGLPFPDRATGPAAAHRPPPVLEPSTYTVRPGDSLWSIARDASPGASDARIARDVDALVTVNRAVLGDPDLIQPGQRLLLPHRAHP